MNKNEGMKKQKMAVWEWEKRVCSFNEEGKNIHVFVFDGYILAWGIRLL